MFYFQLHFVFSWHKAAVPTARISTRAHDAAARIKRLPFPHCCLLQWNGDVEEEELRAQKSSKKGAAGAVKERSKKKGIGGEVDAKCIGTNLPRGRLGAGNSRS